MILKFYELKYILLTSSALAYESAFAYLKSVSNYRAESTASDALTCISIIEFN